MAKDVSIIYTGSGPGREAVIFPTPRIAWEFLEYLTEELRRNGFRSWYLAKSLKSLLSFHQEISEIGLDPEEAEFPVLIIGTSSPGEAREWIMDDLGLPQTGQVAEVEPTDVGL